VKVKENGGTILIEKLPAFLRGKGSGRAGGVSSILLASELTFQPDPLGDDNLSRIDPFEVGKAMMLEQGFQSVSMVTCQ
jgi:hypothetical protein